MRNLKRVLSLTLASIMLMGLMVVGAGAVDYPDVDAVSHNIEAIEVLGALGIFEGDDNGEFRPDEPVTRAEMAKIMAVTLGLDYQRYEGSHPFTDTVGHWAENYIAACTANKVINGRGNGIYDPSATVTAIEASAMLMRAMGYFKYASDVADGFEIATMSQASKIGLYSGIEGSAYNGMPRNDVAQLVLNALQTPMVEVASVATTVTTADGVVVNTGVTRYTERVVTDRNATSTTDSVYGKIEGAVAGGNGAPYQFYVELGEELYDGKLVKTTGQEDDFGRPATEWKYNNSVVGKYSDKPDLVYTKKVKGKDIWADLGKPTTIGNTYYVLDGDTTFASTGWTNNDTDNDAGGVLDTDYKVAESGKENFYHTGKGVLTQVYYDEDTGEVNLYITHTWLAKATADYDEDDDSLAIEVLSAQATSGSFESELDGEDFAISGYKKDDYLLVTASYKDGSEYKIQSVSPAIVVSGVGVNAYKAKESVTASDGKTYDYAYALTDDTDALGSEFISGTKFDMENGEYDLYLDQYGYVVGVEKVSGGSVVSDYLFIDEVNPNKFGGNWEAHAIFMDGTDKIIKVSKTADKDGSLKKVEDIEDGMPAGDDIDAGKLVPGCFYTYSVDKNGEYQLTSVGANGDAQGRIAAGNDSAANTTYEIDPDAEKPMYPIVYKVGGDTKIVDEDNVLPVTNKTLFVADDKVYVGMKNTPEVTWYSNVSGSEVDTSLYYVLDDDTQYIAVLLSFKSGKSSSSADEWVYVHKQGSTYSDYTEFDVIRDGKKDTLKVDKDSVSNLSSNFAGLFKITGWTEDGYAEIGDEATKTYFKAGSNHEGSDVYSTHVDVNTDITYLEGILKIAGNGEKATYVVDEDATIYLLSANDSAKSVSSVSVISPDRLGSLPKSDSGYDVYLMLKDKDKLDVKVAFFVKMDT